MPGAESHITNITQAIQLAIAPVFLLTAVGAIINALMGRLGRAVDRRRKVEEILQDAPGEQYENLMLELKFLARRTTLVLWSMGLAVLCALLVCLLIGTAFMGAILFLDLSRTVAILFIAAVLCLTLCLLLFMREVLLAAMSVSDSVWPHPVRVARK